ncbi:MAG: hypothetical protein AB7I50_00540 [Vicinamibacterales bacterium]
MARPNNAGAISAYIDGMRQAKARFQALPVVMQEKRLNVNSATAAAVAVGARQRLLSSPSIQTRSLLNHVKWKVTKTNGTALVGVTSGSTVQQVTVRVGNAAVLKKVRSKGIIIAGRGGSALKSQGAKIIRPSRYAHLIEFGWLKAPAEPFMIPATNAQKEPHLQRWRAAGREIERDLAGGGGLL